MITDRADHDEAIQVITIAEMRTLTPAEAAYLESFTGTTMPLGFMSSAA